jgi:aspartate oxidase
MIRFLAGDVTAAQADAEKARELLETRVREQPNDFRSLRALSWVYLALNRKADAINIARHTLDLLSPGKDAVLGSGNLAVLAEMQARQALRKKQWRICDICFHSGWRGGFPSATKNRSSLGPDPQ